MYIATHKVTSQRAKTGPDYNTQADPQEIDGIAGSFIVSLKKYLTN
jgi:hypothetical protein